MCGCTLSNTKRQWTRVVSASTEVPEEDSGPEHEFMAQTVRVDAEISHASPCSSQSEDVRAMVTCVTTISRVCWLGYFLHLGTFDKPKTWMPF